MAFKGYVRKLDGRVVEAVQNVDVAAVVAFVGDRDVLISPRGFARVHDNGRTLHVIRGDWLVRAAGELQIVPDKPTPTAKGFAELYEEAPE